MIEIIFYGRGGQGAVMASQILATAAFLEGKYAQAFPRFGGERKGAPVMAYVRISSDPIEVRNIVEQPDMVIVLDSALLQTEEPLDSLRTNGLAIINTDKSSGVIKKPSKKKNIGVDTIDATALSERIYGQSSIPIVNVSMLGYLAARTQVIQVASLLASIDKYFTGDNADKARESVKLASEHMNTGG